MNENIFSSLHDPAPHLVADREAAMDPARMIVEAAEQANPPESERGSITEVTLPRLGSSDKAHCLHPFDELPSWAMVLEVRHLKLIDAIVESGSVTRAAETLHLTQSAISHQLRDLEDRLETPVFARVGKRMVMTQAGHRIHAIARRIMTELRTCEEEVRQIGRHGRGLIRVCTQCNTGYYWLPSLLETFHQKHPGIDVQIRPEATLRPLEALLEGELDVAVVTDDVHDERFSTRPLFRDEQVVIVSPRHALAKRRVVEATALADQHLMLYSAAPGHSFTWTKVLAPAGVTPARLTRVPLTEAIIEMVRAGMGVSVLPRWSVEPAIRDGIIRALRITRHGVYRQWTAVQLAAREEPPYVRSFLDLLATRAIPARGRQPRRSDRSLSGPYAAPVASSARG